MEFLKLIGGTSAVTSHRDFLEEAAALAESVIGIVAYWTAAIDDLPGLIKLTEGANSFICLDPSPPTDLKLLLSFNNIGANFYAFNYEITGSETREGLLHSKVFLFDNSDNTAVLVLGSHNATKRALYGVNIEHSLAFNLKKDEPLYLDIRSQIMAIKNRFCSRIIRVNEPDEKEEQVYVMIIVGDRMDTLVQEKIITVFYKKASEAVKTTETQLYILAIEAESKDEYLYEAVIKQSGSFETYLEKTTEIEFGQRRYAEKDPDMIPFLYQENKVSIDINKNHCYFNTIQVVERVRNFNLYTYKKEEQSDDSLDQLREIISQAEIEGKVSLNSKIKSVSTRMNFNIDFEPSRIKSYYLSPTQNLFNDGVRSPNFRYYPRHRKVREKMFFKTK